MKKFLTALVFGLALVISAPSFAQTKKIDRNSVQHKEWVENFRKKHDIKKAPAKKKQEAKKPAKKKQSAKKAPAKKK